MDRTKILGCLISAALLGACSHTNYIAVGSKNFTEQLILGEIVAQHLERLHFPVERKFGLGGTLLAQQGLLSKDLDLYPEYTGTALTNVLKQRPNSDPAAVLERLRAAYSKQGLEWLPPLGFNNSFAMSVRGEEARAAHWQTLSDAARDSRRLELGAGYEFLTRPDGYLLLTSAYGFHWKGQPKSMDLGLLYQALKQRQVDMAAGSATDGTLTVIDAQVLADDKHVFPPYEACIVARADVLNRPGVRAALLQLSGKIDSAAMRKMNYEVDGQHHRPSQVAKEFLDRQNSSFKAN